VDLHRESIKNSPEYDPVAPVNQVYEEPLHDHYGRPNYWSGHKSGKQECGELRPREVYAVRQSRQGGGSGRGAGRGPGRMSGRQAGGPGGNCVCPKCGHKVKHTAGQPCYQMECPKCGTQMTRRCRNSPLNAR
jgi:hypothetical protein